ncbi:esterase/lipase family protein [Streptomyces sp. NPDC001410]|uniref:esterase/lipase family protein n=1 Tax=Streptomyces sp. NPDC001410 TaxID=3364574 RepID=UPI00367F4F58
MATDAGNWNTMADRFRTGGWPCSYPTEVDRLLVAAGATKIDIVSHSMGGLTSR